MLVALVVKCAVRAVYAPPTSLGRDTRAAWVVVIAMADTPTCSLCKNTQLDRLPSEVTQDRMFKRKGIPVQLCAVCDGPEGKPGPSAVDRALAEYRKRTYFDER